MTEKKEYHIPITEDGKTAVDWLSKTSSLSRQSIKQCMQKGAVWLSKGKSTQRLRRAKKPLVIGDEIHFYHDKKVLKMQPPPANLISDEGDYSIWHKPYGMLSQGSKWGDHCTVYRWAEQHLQPERPAFIVHRLDRAATGLIMVAHKKKTATLLSQLFQQRKIEKHYQVLVHGELQTAMTIDKPLDNKKAISHIKLIEYNAKAQQSLLDVHIETGRKHQIRRHLSQQGFSVVGDRMYGIDKDAKQNLQLSAVFLQFICPITKLEKCFCSGQVFPHTSSSDKS